MELSIPFRCRKSIRETITIPDQHSSPKSPVKMSGITLSPLMILLTAPLLRTSSISWLIRRSRKRRTGPWDRSSRKKNCTSKLTANNVSSLLHEPVAASVLVLWDRPTSASSSASNSYEDVERTCCDFGNGLSYRESHQIFGLSVVAVTDVMPITKSGSTAHALGPFRVHYIFYTLDVNFT